MTVRLHRLTSRLGAELDEITPAHLQQICDLRLAEDVDLDFKGQDAYTAKGPDGLDELAKDVTALANSRGGLIVIGIEEDSQGCADKLAPGPVDDKKIGGMHNGLRSRIFPFLPEIFIKNLETTPGAGDGYVLIAVAPSPMAPHAVRMTSKPQYSYARRVGRTTAWLEESEIAALYRDRFRLAEDHRDHAARTLEAGSGWTRLVRGAATDRVYLELALVPSVPGERRVDTAHISGLSGFFRLLSRPGAAPSGVGGFANTNPELLRGRLRIEPYASPRACEAYADGRFYVRAEIGHPRDNSSTPVINSNGMELWLLTLLHTGAKYAEWAGAGGDVDVLAVLTGPSNVITTTAPYTARFPGMERARQRTDDSPVHATSTLDALSSDPLQLVACARRLAEDLLTDLGLVETSMLQAQGEIRSARLDSEAQATLEAWMTAVGLPVPD